MHDHAPGIVYRNIDARIHARLTDRTKGEDEGLFLASASMSDV